MGLWRGKKGSSVFYRVANSRNAQKQGIRERVYEVKNPRTSGMAGQRMKLLPAIRIYGQLKEIIDRGFETTRYGVPSFRKFMSKALRMKSGFPAVPSGENRCLPGTYQISSGSLYCPVGDWGDQSSYSPDLFYTNNGSLPSTYGQFCQNLVDSNNWLSDGDQITFVLCCGLDDVIPSDAWPWDSEKFSWTTASLFIDCNSQEELSSVSGGTLNLRFGSLILQVPLTYYRAISCSISPYSQNGPVIYAFSTILSRLSKNGRPLRSTSILNCFDSYKAVFINSNINISRARRTYQNQSALSSDWPVQAEEVETSESSDNGGGGGDVTPEDRP